ncbi:MAG: hypothetical protein GXC76_16825, partial [Rhodanobacteraceae bacterium]|nr:hypothetical protein [Rhodanobacteraceae bacterium]
MLVAPLPSSVVRSVPPPRASRRGPDLRRLLATWLAVGLGVLAAVPAARGDAQFGATFPFWLVAAPLIGLAWLQRAALAGFARRLRV